MWRILVPTWRFFDAVGIHPELLVNANGEWRPAFTRPRFAWHSMFFNPQGGLYHARCNLLERFVAELAEGRSAEELVSFALIRDLAGAGEFKVTVAGDEVFHYREAAP